MTLAAVPPHRSAARCRGWSLLGAGLLLCVLLATALALGPRPGRPPTATASQPTSTDGVSGPPWRLGAAHARFTLLVYADLECPFCQTYVPQLHAWALAQPDVALQWQHAPLSAHEPAAGDAARWAECVGERFGPQGFWAAVLWVYQHSRGSGQGLPTGLSHPEFDGAATGACLASQRPAATVREQAEQARAAGVLGTPTVRLVDTQTGRALSLTGPVHGDALASALDWLVTPASDGADELSAEVIGDMPR